VNVGIGCGTIIEGELYEGANGSAGEIGHTTVIPDGYRCKCGNTGCLETVSSLPAIGIRAIEKIKQGRVSLLRDLVKGVIESITGEMVVKLPRGIRWLLKSSRGGSLSGHIHRQRD
jgi:glucokinase